MLSTPLPVENPAIDRCFNTAAFSTPAPYTFGNVSRTLPNIPRDSMYNLHLSLFKHFTFRQRFTMQAPPEAFHLTTSPPFPTPPPS